MKYKLLIVIFLTLGIGKGYTQELINGGDFETPGAWTSSGDFYYNNTYCCNYHSATSYAYVSDASGNPKNNALGNLYQTVYIPSNTTSLTLSFWTYIGTLETTSTIQNDVLHITISNGSTTDNVYLSNLDWSSGYVQHSYTVAGYTNYLGQNVTLNFNGTTNSSLATKYRIDDVSLIAIVPSCTSPTATVNDNSGTGSVTMNCSVSGGSGGSIAYKWYSGTSCSGTVLSTSSSYTTSTSGNYSCKAYISGYESICYDCDYGYATINTSCTSPTATVNDNSGIGSVTMNCSVSGGSGGSIAYKWYSGTSCSGTVLSTSSSYTTSTSGNYSCKAYISGYESTCYDCDYGYATINTSCTSPTATVNDNSGIGSVTMNCSVSGGSGGSIAHKWYSGTSCSGTVLGTSSSYTTSTSGNYSCKAYISGYESTCYDCDYGYATINTSSPTVTITSPNGGENWTLGTPYNITASITGIFYSKLLEISYDGGTSWLSCIGYIPNSSTILNYSWTPLVQTSNSCKIRVTINYNGGSVSDISDGNFSIVAPNNGIGFSLNSSLSHLYWPFADGSSWDCVDRNGFHGGWNNPNTTCDGGVGSGHGEDGHDLSEYYADDWNNSILGSCDRDFNAPLSGTIIFSSNTCQQDPTSCKSISNTQLTCGHGFGRQVIIQSDVCPSYIFRVSHLKTVYVTGGHVNIGDPLGLIGGTGHSTGPHAHCVLYRNISSNYDANLGMSSIDRLIFNPNNWSANGNVLNYQSHPLPPSPPIPYDNTDNYACNFMFDAVSGGSGGGYVESPIQINGSVSICQGDSTILTSLSGAHYLWNTGDTTQSIIVYNQGSYNVIVIDSFDNSSYSQTITITVKQPYTPIIYQSSDYLCLGSSIILSAFLNSNDSLSDVTSEYNNYHFLWSTNDTTYNTVINAPGVYSLTLTSGLSCVGGTTSITILQSNSPTQPTIQVNGMSLACNTSNGVTYQWNFNGQPLLNDTLQILNADTTGYYTVTIFDMTTGCSSTSIPMYVVVGIENIASNNSLKIYPNPTNDKLNVEFDLAISHREISLKLFNSLGQVVMFDKIANSPSGTFKKILDMRNLGDGIYQLQIKLDDGTYINRKVVIQK